VLGFDQEDLGDLQVIYRGRTRSWISRVRLPAARG
jgi:hypothetical protein